MTDAAAGSAVSAGGPNAPAQPPRGTPEDHGGLRSLESWGSTREYLTAIWARRDFVAALPTEQLRTAHLNTVLGNFWHLLNPLFTVAVFYLIFGVFFGAQAQTPNYIVWLIIGVFVFGVTQSSVLGGAKAIADGVGLMKSFRFPRAIIPLASVIGDLITFGFQALVIGAVALGSGLLPTSRWLALPLIVGVHTAFNLGGALVAARLNDSFRDIQQVIPFAFRLLQYVSGVMIPVATLLRSNNSLMRAVVTYNPMVQLIELYRWAIMGTGISVRMATIAVIEAIALLVFGYRFFRVAEHRYGRV